MLGKLLNHEFRATGRTMLPIYAAVLVLAVLGNLSIRFIDVTDSTVLRILFGLLIALFVIGMIAAAVMTLVLMVSRFYRNLLKEEGYLMHTLPVSVHGLVWSKLIVSFVWFLATTVVIWLVIVLTGLIQTGTGLGELIIAFPSREEIRELLADMGITSGSVWKTLTWFGVTAIAYCLVACLHFYAAMSLGHMFNKDKVLLSIVFFVVISFLFSALSTGYSASVIMRQSEEWIIENATVGPAQSLILARQISGRALGLELIQGALLYLATVLGLKKGLNLA